jgi:hypothetical protein
MTAMTRAVNDLFGWVSDVRIRCPKQADAAKDPFKEAYDSDRALMVMLIDLPN